MSGEDQQYSICPLPFVRIGGGVAAVLAILLREEPYVVDVFDVHCVNMYLKTPVVSSMSTAAFPSNGRCPQLQYLSCGLIQT